MPVRFSFGVVATALDPRSVRRSADSQQTVAAFAVLVVWLLSLGGPAQAQPSNAATLESTTTARVDRIERSSRVVTLRGGGNSFQTVYVDEGIAAFDDLKVGDMVTVRYTESVIVEVRPDAKLEPTQDTTQEAREAGDGRIVKQLKAVVRIEEIDPQGLFVTYRSGDNRRIRHAVRDKSLLEGVRAGDRVAITVTIARAVSIERGERP